jgi:hypothetical protein
MSAPIVGQGCSEPSSAIAVTPSCAALVSAACVQAAMSQLRSTNSGTPDPTTMTPITTTDPSSFEQQWGPGCELRVLAPIRVRSRFWPRVRAAADVLVEPSGREVQCVRLEQGAGEGGRGSAAREVAARFGPGGYQGEGTLRAGNARPASARTRPDRGAAGGDPQPPAWCFRAALRQVVQALRLPAGR